MKTTIQFITLALASLALSAGSLNAAEEIKAGPKGGRLLETASGPAEFFVEQDRTVSITFYDAAMKPVAPGDQIVTATAEAPSGKTKLEFEKKDDMLVSKQPLPEGEGYNVVVQVKDNADAKPKNFRIPLKMNICKGCNRPDYACTCGDD